MQKIDRVYAYIGCPKDKEIVCSISDGHSYLFPMMSADLEVVKRAKESIQQLANTSGETFTLREFTLGQDIEEIKPKPP